jgi:hypothetical protein
MKLSTQQELEVKLLEQQIRFYLLVNGILACTVFAGLAYLLYKIMKAIFA